jgi:peroxiredoxin
VFHEKIILEKGELKMPKVNIDAAAPDFTLQDYHGNVVSLSHFQAQQNVLLVFNRGFM